MKTILLKFAGPMQSWGTSSHFETRHTDYYPSKSAVIGMISASLGYSREAGDAICGLDVLGFMVRIDQPGSLLRDYHTAQKYKANGDFERTYVTNRYYMEDAVYLVAVSGEDDLIQTIYEGLLHPYYPLFLGKRALPVNHDFVLEMKEEKALDIIKVYPWQAASWYQRRSRDSAEVRLDIYGDRDLIPDCDRSHNRRDRVESFSQKERRFTLRQEAHCSTMVNNPEFQETEHDIFAYLEE